MNFLIKVVDEKGNVKFKIDHYDNRNFLDLLKVDTYYDQKEKKSFDSPMLSEINLTIDYKVLLEDLLIGTAQLYLDPRINKLIWSSFNPSARLLCGQRRGIGTKSHLLILEDVSRGFPQVKQYDVTHSPGFVSEARKIHLRKMGLEGVWFNWSNEVAIEFRRKSPEEYWRLVSLPFSEYYERSLKYAQSKGIVA